MHHDLFPKLRYSRVFGAKLTNAAPYPIEFGDREYGGGTRVIKFIASSANDKIHILLR